MFNLVLVMLGGALGSGLRYWIGQLMPVPVGAIPLPTLAVNVIGSGVLGAVSVLAMNAPVMPREMALLLGTGVCGGFTTFSAVSVEILSLWESGQPFIALLYIGISLLGGVLAAIVGVALARAAMYAP